MSCSVLSVLTQWNRAAPLSSTGTWPDEEKTKQNKPSDFSDVMLDFRAVTSFSLPQDASVPGHWYLRTAS